MDPCDYKESYDTKNTNVDTEKDWQVYTKPCNAIQKTFAPYDKLCPSNMKIMNKYNTNQLSCVKHDGNNNSVGERVFDGEQIKICSIKNPPKAPYGYTFSDDQDLCNLIVTNDKIKNWEAVYLYSYDKNE